jgi:DNA-binding response OmpR family regulator
MRGDGKRLLIVVADMATRVSLSSLFRGEGWEVAAARSVAEGLASLDPLPDWVVLDLWLPDGDGEKVLRAVRGAGTTCRVALLSGEPDPARLLRLMRLDPDLVMPRPIDFDLLFAVCSRDGAARPVAARPPCDLLALEG